MNTNQYTIDELCELTGLSRRTIRYYVQEGIIDPPAGRGRGGFYYDSQLEKLGQIRSLQEQGMTLSLIREQLRGPETPAAPYSRDVWVRYEIMPGMEITVRRDLEEKEARRIAQLVRIARTTMKEGSHHE